MALHRDAALIDRLGRETIIEHFDCSDAVIRRWRRHGLSKMVRKPFTLLCRLHGIVE